MLRMTCWDRCCGYMTSLSFDVLTMTRMNWRFTCRQMGGGERVTHMNWRLTNTKRWEATRGKSERHDPASSALFFLHQLQDLFCFHGSNHTQPAAIACTPSRQRSTATAHCGGGTHAAATAAARPVLLLLTAHLGQRGMVEIHNGDHLAQTSRPP